jgi:hypothetical protein
MTVERRLLVDERGGDRRLPNRADDRTSRRADRGKRFEWNALDLMPDVD